MLGKEGDHPEGVALYWKMVDMVKNGKRIDYEFDVIDERSPEHIAERPLPKGYKK